MRHRPFAHARGRVGRLRPSRPLALLGSLSAAFAFLAAAGAVHAAPTAAARSAGSGPTVALRGATATVPAGARPVGVEPSSSIVHLDVVLLPRDPAALTKYATEVATPGSPVYHDYLPRGVFPSVFGPTPTAIAAVRAALTSLGLHPGKNSANHLAIPVTATAGRVEAAFGTKLNRYRLAAGGFGFANATAPKLPAAAAPYIESIIGLDSLIRLHPLLTRPGKVTRAKATGITPGAKAQPHVKTGGPQPCRSALNAQTSIFNGSGGDSWVLTADQLAHEYEYDKLYQAGDLGKGQTVGIIELGESNLNSDISAFQKCYGTGVQVSYQNIDGFKPKGAGEGEAALDIETVIAEAPEANIVVYRGSSNGNGWYQTFGTAAAEDVAQVESVSYGLCEAGFGQLLGKNLAGALNVIYEQQAVQGQTVVVSSGDTGSEGCLRVDSSQPGLLSAEYPGSDPFVLGVGGTSVVSSNPKPRNFEVVWNDGFDQEGAGGGGESAFFNEPSYQTSFGVSSGGTRGVPDVSADADPETGYLVLYKGGWIPVGGTSAAAPLWAALMALTNTKCKSSPVGFVNPAMYFAASPKVTAVVLNDIQADPTDFPGNVSNDYTADGGGQYPVLVGYDMATGLGSPVGGVLANQLCKTAAQAGGYRMVTAQGQVYSFHAPNYGSVRHPGARIAGIADDPKTNGYWVVTTKGTVSAFHAPSLGSARNPSSPVVGIAADNNGSGYWLVTAKGHVYGFHAPSHGSVQGKLAAPVVGIAADPFTNGYWVVTSAGKVYAFGAGNYPGKKLSKVTAIAADPSRQGYWLVTANGHVYAFNVPGQGSMPAGNLFGNTTGISGDQASGGAGGYWLSTTFGLVAGFNAVVHGAHPFQTTKNPIVGIAGTR